MGWNSFWNRLLRRSSPEEKERRRRLEVNRKGRMVDATVVDLQGDMITYTYSVRGIAYTASQDIHSLRAMLPPNPLSVIGPATAKYDLSNPANSIVLCETWSGIPQRVQKAAG